MPDIATLRRALRDCPVLAGRDMIKPMFWMKAYCIGNPNIIFNFLILFIIYASPMSPI